MNLFLLVTMIWSLGGQKAPASDLALLSKASSSFSPSWHNRLTSRPDSIESWNELTRLIQQHGIRSLDDLIAALPEGYLAGHSLIYQPKALMRHYASTERPRVMTFGLNGKFIMTYNTLRDPNSQLERVETIEFKGHRAYLRELVFDGQSDPLENPIPVNPRSCTQCHGESPRGLWDPYNNWAGVYGSISRAGIDFIGLQTPEYHGLLSFLKTKSAEPRYSRLPIKIELFSKKSKNETLLRPFNPETMNDALVISDGYGSNPNMRVGFYLGDHNFFRLAHILKSQSKDKRQAFQYFVKAMSLDEKTIVKRTMGHTLDGTTINPPVLAPDLFTKKFPCLEQVESFFPDHIKQHYPSYSETHSEVMDSIRQDYVRTKFLVERTNLGLTKFGAGFVDEDVFDADRAGRKLMFDPVLSAVFVSEVTFKGRSNSTTLIYLFRLMGLPTGDMASAVHGARYNFFYGNHSSCYADPGGHPSSLYYDSNTKTYCFREPVEEFFTLYLENPESGSGSFYVDPELQHDNWTCEELAEKSRAALTHYGQRYTQSD